MNCLLLNVLGNAFYMDIMSCKIVLSDLYLTWIGLSSRSNCYSVNYFLKFQDMSDPVMTAYKLVTIDAPYWGFGNKLERALLLVGSLRFDYQLLFLLYVTHL